jgi:hypothetical protein
VTLLPGRVTFGAKGFLAVSFSSIFSPITFGRHGITFSDLVRGILNALMSQATMQFVGNFSRSNWCMITSNSSRFDK